MSEGTHVGWTGRINKSGIFKPGNTFNIAWGCHKVSDGCAHCYAEHLSDHRYGKNLWGPVKTTRRQMMSEAYWKEPLRWNRKAEEEGERVRVFCGSMCDWAEDHPDLVEPRERLFTLIELTPWLDWLLLTKRPENIEHFMPERWEIYNEGLPRNIWFGTSVEDQKNFDKRWPELETFARRWNPAIIFLSVEPLLGPINLQEALLEGDFGDEDRGPTWTRPVDWVIVGGESGNEARPMDLEWARSVRDQCAEAEVPFFFKQVGTNKQINGVWGGDKLDGETYYAWPETYELPVTRPAEPPELPNQLSMF